MTILYHYTTHGQEIEQMGRIQTELKRGSGDGDGYDMDYVWLTESRTIPGACHNTVLGFTYGLADALQGRAVLPPHLNQWPQNRPIVFTRWSFDADDIGAEPWMRERRRWAGISPSKQRFVREIDLKSTMNGDNVETYWVAPRDIPIASARGREEIQTTFNDVVRDLGFTTPQQLYTYGREFIIKNRGAWLKKYPAEMV